MSDLRTAAKQALVACKLIVSAFDALKPASAARNEPLQINAARASITALEAALADPGSDYERGFVDGMLEQARRSVDKAVNAMAEPIIKPEIKEDKPFGYFRAEPFGWTDCAPTDEGAIPLYERPQAQQFLYNAWAR